MNTQDQMRQHPAALFSASNSLRAHGRPSPGAKPMMHVAYFPLTSPKLLTFPYFRKINKFSIFSFNLRFLLNLHLLLPPIFFTMMHLCIMLYYWTPCIGR